LRYCGRAQVDSQGRSPLVLRIQNEDPAPGGAEVSAPRIAMPQSFACLHYHLIFSTKGRTPFLVGDLPSRLYAYVGGIIRDENGTLVAAGGMPDHVHFLVSLSRESAVSDVLRQIIGKFVAMDSRDDSRSSRVRLASWVCRVRGELFPCRDRETIHRDAGRSSPDRHVSGRISGVPAATQS
jgi:REP element-mobilizing transposase RayT